MFTCPHCGRRKSRPSIQSGMIDALMRLFLMAPIRCRCCRSRFYRFALPGSKFYVYRP